MNMLANRTMTKDTTVESLVRPCLVARDTRAATPRARKNGSTRKGWLMHTSNVPAMATRTACRTPRPRRANSSDAKSTSSPTWATAKCGDVVALTSVLDSGTPKSDIRLGCASNGPSPTFINARIVASTAVRSPSGKQSPKNQRAMTGRTRTTMRRGRW